MWCHLLLLMPILGLALFAVLPLSLALPAYGVIAAVSLLLYGKIMQAMRMPAQTGREEMVGAVVEVVSEAGSEGLIRYKGELWTAMSKEKLRPGAEVVIVGFEGLRALVRGRGQGGRAAGGA
ncbi:MAG: NfeD family protein [Anaerolineae bacterium]